MMEKKYFVRLVKQVNNILKIFKIYSHNEKNCKKTICAIKEALFKKDRR